MRLNPPIKTEDLAPHPETKVFLSTQIMPAPSCRARSLRSSRSVHTFFDITIRIPLVAPQLCRAERAKP